MKKEVKIDDQNPPNQETVSFISSENPSYSKFTIPYHAVCRIRYEEAKKKYDKQFLYELKMQEAMQNSAYDAMRFHRHFVITTLWPPLHTKKEINYVLNKMFKLTSKQQSRLNYLLTYKIS